MLARAPSSTSLSTADLNMLPLSEPTSMPASPPAWKILRSMEQSRCSTRGDGAEAYRATESHRHCRCAWTARQTKHSPADRPRVLQHHLPVEGLAGLGLEMQDDVACSFLSPQGVVRFEFPDARFEFLPIITVLSLVTSRDLVRAPLMLDLACTRAHQGRPAEDAVAPLPSVLSFAPAPSQLEKCWG